jgi:hypothetical protein
MFIPSLELILEKLPFFCLMLKITDFFWTLSFKVSFTSVAHGGGVTAGVTTRKGDSSITLLLTNKTRPKEWLVWTGSFLSFSYSHTLSRRHMFSISRALRLSLISAWNTKKKKFFFGFHYNTELQRSIGHRCPAL